MAPHVLSYREKWKLCFISSNREWPFSIKIKISPRSGWSAAQNLLHFLWKLVKSSEVRRNIFSYIEILRFPKNTSKIYTSNKDGDTSIPKNKSRSTVTFNQQLYSCGNTSISRTNSRSTIIYNTVRGRAHCNQLLKPKPFVVIYDVFPAASSRNHDVDIGTSRVNVNMHIFLLLCWESLLQDEVLLIQASDPIEVKVSQIKIRERHSYL